LSEPVFLSAYGYSTGEPGEFHTNPVSFFRMKFILARNIGTIAQSVAVNTGFRMKRIYDNFCYGDAYFRLRIIFP
jgi:hypothetical protein